MNERNRNNADAHSRLRYEQQQKDIDEVCTELGLKAFRPNYHGKGTDCNTVLIYTIESERYNSEMESAYRKKYGFDPPAEYYRPYVCFLQNTDINGRFNLSFLNHGTVDLCIFPCYRASEQRQTQKQRIKEFIHKQMTEKYYCGERM